MASPHSAAAAAVVATALNNDPTTAAADGPPPAPRVHRHALESIFAFLDLRDLATALRASRDWQAAVGSMRRLNLAVNQPAATLVVLARSMMGRHIGEIGRSGPRVDLDADTLSILADRMPHLRQLDCAIELPPSDPPLLFPAQLRRLGIILSGPTDANDINAAIVTISQLPLLQDLDMSLPAIDPQISFTPLAALPQLRRLDVFWRRGELSDAQVDELRALPHLQSVYFNLTVQSMRRLLRQPHDLQWQQISLPDWLDDEVAALLPQLPSLTKIDDAVSCESFDWLRGLPNLTDVRLWFNSPAGAAGRVESLVAGLRCCTKIEILLLADLPDLTAAQLAGLLPRLSRLWKLSLDSLHIDSLSFLSQPPLTSQLSIFELWRCRQLPLTELRHVHELRGLRHLIVHQSFAAPLDDRSLSQLTPPSALLPQLEELKYASCSTAAAAT